MRISFIFLVIAAVGLMLPILLIALVVAAIAQSRKAGVVVGLILASVFFSLLILVGFWVVFRVRSNVSVATRAPAVEQRLPPVERVESLPPTPVPPTLPSSGEQPAVPPTIPDAASNEPSFSSSSPWDGVVEDTLAASVYSSAANAARALAREALVDLGSDMAETPAAIVIVLDPTLSERIPTLGTQVSEVLRNAFPLANVFESSAAADPVQLTIQLDEPEFRSLPSTGPKAASLSSGGLTSASGWADSWLPQAAGALRLRATYQEHVFEAVKRYTDKPWVDQFDEFVSSHPDRFLLRADCRTFANDEASAYRDAVRAAVDLLMPRVMTLVEAETIRGLPRVPEVFVRRQLSAAVERNELVADRFSQELQGSFGQVWRATLLLDFQPQQLIQMADQGHLVQRAEQRHEIGTGLAVVLMLGLVLALYIVLNELTKGYFVWNLRAAALLALLTMVVVFCWWIG